MPVIQFNPGYFIELGLLPFPLIVARLFLDGGWIPILFVLFQGFWKLWVQSRQQKYGATLTYTLLAIDVPRNNEQTPKAVEQIFSHLSAAYIWMDRIEKYWEGKFQPTFSFELVSIDGYVQFLVRTPTKFRDLIESSVFAQYPEAEIIEVADYADKVPAVHPDPDWDVFGSEYVLRKPSAFPIRLYSEFEHSIAEVPISDPMSAMLEVMGSLRRGEQLWVQFLLTPNDDSWKDASQVVVDKMLGKKAAPKASVLDDVLAIPMWAVTEMTGMFGPGEGGEKKPDTPKMAALSPGEKDVLESVQLKMSKIGFNAKIRLIYTGRRNVFSKGRFTQFNGALTQFTALNSNGIRPYGPTLPKGTYFYQRWSEQTKKMNILRNYRNRSNRGAPPYILNIEELATLYHFPMIQVKAPLVKKTEAKRAEPPVFLPTEEDVHSSPFERVKPKPKEQPKPAPKPEPDEEGSDYDGDAPGNLPFA